MQLCYIGNHALPYATEKYICDDAERCGHEVLRIQEPRVVDRTWMARTAEACADLDLVLYSKTYGLPNDAVELWRKLEQRGVQTASIHLDLYVGLQRGNELQSDPFWRTGTVFTADGDEYSAMQFSAHGINHHWLPPGVVSAECLPGMYRPELAADVAFVGSKRYHPTWPFRGQLLDALNRRYGSAFALCGHDGTRVYGFDLNDLYASVTAVAGDSLVLPNHRRYWSDRLPETLGRGGALVFPRIDGLEEQGFVDGEHLRLYEPANLEAIMTVLDELIADPVEARAMAMRGQELVRDRHTYVHRVREILEVLELS